MFTEVWEYQLVSDIHSNKEITSQGVIFFVIFFEKSFGKSKIICNFVMGLETSKGIKISKNKEL